MKIRYNVIKNNVQFNGFPIVNPALQRWENFGKLAIAQWLFGVRHVGLAFYNECNLSLIHRIQHLAIGIFECVPLLGAGVASLDYLINRCRNSKKIPICRIDSEEPYEKGFEHGRKYKKKIREIYYEVVLPWIRRQATQQEIDIRVQRLNLSENIKKELEGLAKGAKIPYEDVLLVNTFLDILPGAVACTCVATVNEGNIQAAIGIDNEMHYGKEDSGLYAKKIAKVANSPKYSIFDALRAVGNDRTMHSLVFKPGNGIDIAIGDGNAPYKRFAHFGNELLFEKKGKAHFVTSENSSASTIQFGRNLDWGMQCLVDETIWLYRKGKNGISTAFLTLPGYIGCLSGMNNEGVAAAVLTMGSAYKEGARPNALHFYELLSAVKTAKEFHEVILKTDLCATMNLMLVDKSEAFRYSFTPSSEKKVFWDGVNSKGQPINYTQRT